jgi:predicted nucleotidyltransferase
VRIEPGEEVVGFPALTMRDLMRKKVFGRAAVAEILKVDETEADRVIAALAAEDYICPYKRPTRPAGADWQTTPKGTKLANASTLPAIPYAEAAKILESFLAAVRTVADDENYFYEVSEVVLFGSFLAAAETVNDIDVIVHLRPRPAFNRPYSEVLKDKLATCPVLKTPRDFLGHLRSEPLALLHDVSPYIALHRPDTLKLIEDADKIRGIENPGTPHRTIYRAPPLAKK